MKKLFRNINWLFILGFGLFLSTSCEKNEPNPYNEAINLALADSRFTVFAKLLTDNDLVGMLNTTEPNTIFAPTNEAFSKIDISKLTKKELLKLLNTHIITKRRFNISEIKSGVVQSPNVEIYLSKNPSGVFINGISKVISPNILASNSIIHVIDHVIIPPTKSLLETLSVNPDFSELVSLISATNNKFQETLAYPTLNGVTVLAPTNAALQELYKTIPKANLLADKKLLNEVLLFQVISKRIFSTDFPNTNEPTNTFLAPVIGTPMFLLGAGTGTETSLTITIPFTGQYQVIFDITNGIKVKGVRSGEANITNVNLLATNGVAHAIDKVLLP
jgi:uncharacterized surface protein with fasciclin (FAS1) repeats